MQSDSLEYGCFFVQIESECNHKDGTIRRYLARDMRGDYAGIVEFEYGLGYNMKNESE